MEARRHEHRDDAECCITRRPRGTTSGQSPVKFMHRVEECVTLYSLARRALRVTLLPSVPINLPVSEFAARPATAYNSQRPRSAEKLSPGRSRIWNFCVPWRFSPALDPTRSRSKTNSNTRSTEIIRYIRPRATHPLCLGFNNVWLPRGHGTIRAGKVRIRKGFVTRIGETAANRDATVEIYSRSRADSSQICGNYS